MKLCPYCSEKIKNTASFCKHCKQDLTTSHAQSLDSLKDGTKFYEKIWFQVLCLILCFPVGIALIVMNAFFKRKKRMQFLSPEEQKASKKMNLLVIGGLGFSTILLFLAFLSPYLSFLVLVCVIWLYPRKHEVILKNRLVDYQNYKLRIVLTAISLIIFTWFSSYLKELKYVQQYPQPQIQILSSQLNQEENKEYLLEIGGKDFTEVWVNNRLIQKDNDGNLQTTIKLDNRKTTIKIEARNQYKATKKEITISRNETESEIAERIAREEKERIQKEEAEKVRQIELAKQETERLQKEKEETERQKSEAERKKLEALKGNRREALVCAEMKVESLLKNPAGAKFESWFSSKDVVALGNNEYMVKSYVDAQNSFGGTIRTNYICTVIFNPKTDKCKSIECIFDE